jgi:UDP-N-acetylglucosamine 4-epimerase
MCYVDNAVHANILAATSDQDRHDGFNGRCYNISCGDRTSNREILDHLKERHSHAVVVNAPWRLGDVMHTQADISRAEEDFGYRPQVRFWEGLEKTLDWWGL